MGTGKHRNGTLLGDAVGTDTILFEEEDGIYWLRGTALSRALSILKQPGCADAVGWDGATFMVYARQLLAQRVKVGVARGTSIHMLQMEKNKHRHKVESTTIGLSAELLDDKRELGRLAGSKKMNTPAMQELISTLTTHLRNGKAEELAQYGTLFVFQVAENIYEIDEKLTTMPREVKDAFLVASFQTGRMLRCQLVEPKGRRRPQGRLPYKSQVEVSEPVTYGQLRFKL